MESWEPVQYDQLEKERFLINALQKKNIYVWPFNPEYRASLGFFAYVRDPDLFVCIWWTSPPINRNVLRFCIIKGKIYPCRLNYYECFRPYSLFSCASCPVLRPVIYLKLFGLKRALMVFIHYFIASAKFVIHTKKSCMWTKSYYILSCLFSKIGVLSRRDLLNHISTEPSGEVDILFRRSRRDRTPILEKRHDSFYISETHLKKIL